MRVYLLHILAVLVVLTTEAWTQFARPQISLPRPVLAMTEPNFCNSQFNNQTFQLSYISPVTIYQEISSSCDGIDISAASTEPISKLFTCNQCNTPQDCSACTHIDYLVQYQQRYVALAYCIAEKQLVSSYEQELYQAISSVEAEIQSFETQVSNYYSSQSQQSTGNFYKLECGGEISSFGQCPIVNGISQCDNTTGITTERSGPPEKKKPPKHICCICSCGIRQCYKFACTVLCRKQWNCCQKQRWWLKKYPFRPRDGYC